MDNGFRTIQPTSEYACRLREVHALIVQGKGDDEQADAIRELMDAPWHAMTAQEQERMRGLAADLNALTENGLRSRLADADQVQAWRREARRFVTDFQSGNYDRALAFLRKPTPAALPSHFVPFLQALCWEKLGDPATAGLFREAAEIDDASLSTLAEGLAQGACP